MLNSNPSVLSRHALVLNRSWFVITSTSVRHALTLLFKGTARVVCTESFELFEFESWLERPLTPGVPRIPTVRRAISAPEVIVLTRYDGVPKRSHGFSRRGLLQRDRFTCQYCRAHLGRADLTIDHVLPSSRGGETTWENCVLACASCNCKKGNRTPDEAGMPLRRAPRRPSPAHHVAAIAEGRSAWKPFLKQLKG